jgi:hypothetical protein
LLTRALLTTTPTDSPAAQLHKYRVRPTALLPLWDVAGYALGVGSALMGKEAAYAVTVAVETVRAPPCWMDLDSQETSRRTEHAAARHPPCSITSTPRACRAVERVFAATLSHPSARHSPILHTDNSSACSQGRSSTVHGQIPNFRDARVHVCTGYNIVEGNRRASRNGRVSPNSLTSRFAKRHDSRPFLIAVRGWCVQVITEHYNEQLRMVHEDKTLHAHTELRDTFRQFRDEEQQHLDTGLQRNAQQAPFYRTITRVVHVGCTSAIWLAKRI